MGGMDRIAVLWQHCASKAIFFWPFFDREFVSMITAKPTGAAPLILGR